MSKNFSITASYYVYHPPVSSCTFSPNFDAGFQDSIWSIFVIEKRYYGFVYQLVQS